MKNFTTSLKFFIFFAILLGIIYPVGITLLANLLMKDKANGSFISQNNKIVGSTLIGQDFQSPKYFYSRFSAINYDATNSGGSNLSQSSKVFMDQTTSYITKVRLENNIVNDVLLPPDMVSASGSGLDPHISLENALLQMKRVAKQRNLTESQVNDLITQSVDLGFIGIWGKDSVNVLKLNLALDGQKAINN